MSQEQNKASIVPVVALVIMLFAVGASMYWKLHHDNAVFLLAKVAFLQAVPFFWLDAGGHLRSIVDMARSPAGVSGADIYVALAKSGAYYSPLVVVIAVYAGIKAKRHPLTKIYRIHDADSLMVAMSSHSPSIIPIVGRDLVNDTSPEWADSKHPEEWVEERGLIVGGELNRDAAEELFAKDLGRRIKSVKALKPHEAALFAVFAEKVWGKKNAYKDLLDALNRSTAGQQRRRKPVPDFRLAQAAFQRHAGRPEVVEVLARHAYVKTFLMEMLEMGRSSGTLPTSEFLWLKPNDRPLFYALNTVGRKTPFLEASAAFAQWKAEKVAAENNYRLDAPCVGKAVDALEHDLLKVGLIQERFS